MSAAANCDKTVFSKPGLSRGEIRSRLTLINRKVLEWIGELMLWIVSHSMNLN